MKAWPKMELQMWSRRMGATVAWVDRPSDGGWPLRVQAFFVPTTMPSADFCTAMTVLANTLSGTFGHDADLPRQD